MKNYSILIGMLLVFLLSNKVFSQNKTIAEQVAERKNDFVLNEVINILTLDSGYNNATIDQELPNKTYLKYDKIAGKNIIDSESELISVRVNVSSNQSFVLDLINFNYTLNDLEVETGSGEKISLENFSVGLYRGTIRGQENSLVSITFFNDELKGFISNQSGNYVIGKIENTEEHIVYKDADALRPPVIFCEYDSEDNKIIKNKNLNSVNRDVETASKCVRIMYETDYNLFVAKGSNVTTVLNYITSLFNGVGAIYNTVPVSLLFYKYIIWTTHDPYTYSAGEPLNIINYTYSYSRLNLEGSDLVQFIRQGSGSGAGSANRETGGSLCNNNPSAHRSQFPSPSTINSYPVYSWPVLASAHEFGHSLGSWHTHECEWNGNNTRIDNCGPQAGYNSGTCPPGTIPSNGGTIMSYCHLLTSVGINFSNGFGLQPGQLILNNVNNSDCVQGCTNCTDFYAIAVDVFANVQDKRQASFYLTARNTLQVNGQGIYHAKEYVLLTNGFNAKSGSQMHVYSDGCSGMYIPKENNTGVIIDTNNRPDLENNILIYPNPANNLVRVEVVGTQIETAKIFSIDNKLVKKNVVYDVYCEIDIQALEKGVYIITIETIDGAVSTKKLIKN